MKTKLIFPLMIALLAAVCTAPQKEEAANEYETMEAPIGEVSYSADTTNLIGYFAYDQTNEEKRPGILVIQNGGDTTNTQESELICLLN